LVFVVPPTDTDTRDLIADLSEDFSWVEVLRDRGPQLRRTERPRDGHQTLAAARNQILQVVERVKPDHYLSWDTDYLVPSGTVESLAALGLPLVTVWGWLNRQPPREIRYFNGRDFRDVWTQDPVCATAMTRDERGPRHYPAEEFIQRSAGVWECDIALAFQLMDARAYRVAHYRPHPAGEDVPFNEMLADRGIPRFCYGDVVGVHLYDRDRKDETALGWPRVMRLAEQAPLAATYFGVRPPEYQASGLFPVQKEVAA
jgi:hypothetical protein